MVTVEAKDVLLIPGIWAPYGLHCCACGSVLPSHANRQSHTHTWTLANCACKSLLWHQNTLTCVCTSLFLNRMKTTRAWFHDKRQIFLEFLVNIRSTQMPQRQTHTLISASFQHEHSYLSNRFSSHDHMILKNKASYMHLSSRQHVSVWQRAYRSQTHTSACRDGKQLISKAAERRVRGTAVYSMSAAYL